MSEKGLLHEKMKVKVENTPNKESQPDQMKDEICCEQANFNFLGNGLVNNVDFYKPIDGKNYYIGFYKNLKLPVNELCIDDYATLYSHGSTKGKWVANLVIDIILALFVKESKSFMTILNELSYIS